MDKLSPIIDISLPLHFKMPKWPGSEGIKIHRSKRLEVGDKVNNSKLECDVHIGTHVDAPLHFIEDGSTVEALPLNLLIGPAVVAAIPEAKVVTAKHLASIGLPPKTERLLLRTRNSDLWASNVTEFREDYTALTADAAQWLVDREIGLVGIDYLSIQIFSDPPATHEILLKGKVVILEGLNLADVKPGKYELICLPIRLVGTEGAPARALLRQIRSDSDH
jgi:arylformamidase